LNSAVMEKLLEDILDDKENLTEENPLSIERYDIAVYPADYTLSVLVEKVNNGDIIIPEFQRGYVWDIKRASKLIESFLLGLPVPPIYLYMRPDGKLLIIDGHQRTKTIQYFFKGIFPYGKRYKQFRLKLNSYKRKSKWHGRSFEDLPEEDKRFLENSIMRAFIVRQIKPDDDTSMFYIFERLNTGGLPLYPMEIRKALYYGNFFKLMEELNTLREWRKIIGSEKQDSRLRDIEYILRFFALYENWQSYEAPMKSFLTDYMSRNKSIPHEKYMHFKEVFHKTVNLIYSSLGSKPFHTVKGEFVSKDVNKKRLNLAVLDSVMVNTAVYINNLNEEKLTSIYNVLKVHQPFIENIKRRDTTRTKTLKERIEIVNKIFQQHVKTS